MNPKLKLRIRKASNCPEIDEREEGSDLELDDINFDDLVVSHNNSDEKAECSMIRKISQTSDISDSPLNLSPPPMRNLVELRNLSLLSMASSLGGLCVECDRLEGDLYASRAQEEKLENLLATEREKNARLERQLEKELMNSLRKQQKLEQDFDFHKQMVVNDCGRHIEELQEEHRESLRIIERRMSMEQREVIFASNEFKKMKLEVAQARKEKRDLQYENTQLKIQLKARKAPKHIKIGGEFVTENQNKSIPGVYDLEENIVHETLEHRPVYKRRTLAQGHRIWLVYNKNNRVWNFQPTKKLFSSVSLVFIRSRAVYPTLIPSDSVHMASNGDTGWAKVTLSIVDHVDAASEIIPIQFQVDSDTESEDKDNTADEVQL